MPRKSTFARSHLRGAVALPITLLFGSAARTTASPRRTRCGA